MTRDENVRKFISDLTGHRLVKEAVDENDRTNSTIIQSRLWALVDKDLHKAVDFIQYSVASGHHLTSSNVRRAALDIAARMVLIAAVSEDGK